MGRFHRWNRVGHLSKGVACRAFTKSAKLNTERQSLSRYWAPTGGIAATPNEDSHDRLIRAGLLRQAYSGIFHFLPLGRRIQEKCQKVIDKHLSALCCSKLSLSTISSDEIWTKSGRLKNGRSELFRFVDKRGTGLLLSPTHEEEITTIVAGAVKSYKELPLRLYQTTRKYRDELRPRHGLLRSREFTMTDLYTFDYSEELALNTYNQAKKAFHNIFSKLKIPFMVAEADSGNIGGDLSHEFHFATPRGEDSIVRCRKCDYTANLEVAQTTAKPESGGQDLPPADSPPGNVLPEEVSEQQLRIWRATSKDRKSLINVYYHDHGDAPTDIVSCLNMHVLRQVCPQLDTSVREVAQLWSDTNQQEHSHSVPRDIINIFDLRVTDTERRLCAMDHPESHAWPVELFGELAHAMKSEVIDSRPDGKPLDLLRVRDGDSCPHCSVGTLSVVKAVELGHTFHLGTRYSEPLGAYVNVPAHALPSSPGGSAEESGACDRSVPIEMGCHGIGVSRLIGTVADILGDARGLNWPRTIAPFEIVLVADKDLSESANMVYDLLSSTAEHVGQFDVVIDDRRNISLPWKLKDADLIGYPVMVVLGRSWRETGLCEVQCRQLSTIKHVLPAELRHLLESLLARI